MKKFSFIALAALLWVSCSQNEPMAVDEQTGSSVDKQVKTGIHAISEEMAIEIANENMACLDPATRSNTKRVASVQKFLNRANAVKTRATNTVEVGYYLINYENEGGFAVVADDDRVLSLHAISDTGSLRMSDTIDNKGLASFFSSLPAGVDTTGIRVTPPGPWVNLPTPPVRQVIVSPLLSESVRKWSQGIPFNWYCDGYPVGCGALSCAMVMTVFEWPASYNSYSFDWTDIKFNPYNDGLAHLLRELGSLQNLDIQYSATGSSSYFEDCIRTFRNFGYEAPDISPFSIGTVKSYLENGQPILIEGRLVDNHSLGHGWILDGLFMTKGYGAVVQPENNKQTFYYPHCVWGAGGRANGYYSFYGSSVGGQDSLISEEEDSQGYGKQFNEWRIIYNFKKR